MCVCFNIYEPKREMKYVGTESTHCFKAAIQTISSSSGSSFAIQILLGRKPMSILANLKFAEIGPLIVREALFSYKRSWVPFEMVLLYETAYAPSLMCTGKLFFSEVQTKFFGFYQIPYMIDIKLCLEKKRMKYI